ncbi:hypothetical protein LshimejAT787_0111340 [Lyophyllum shimeji]|uniref:Uncharacterized protein n=1 Tax=Lyophyllum shimeji TaxID=47721 RepID=A0A9P3PDY1_LYOSH|nr:hypothetical protein LshimejAT787_0111340 [Lyophyllum shimeji]
MAAESIFNYFVGGLALLSTLFSMLFYLNVYLPGPRMKAFDETLAETKTIYEKAQAEGLLPPDMSRKARVQLQEYEYQADDLRAITYQTLSMFDMLLSIFGGHSTKIADLSSEVKGLRRILLTTSQKERARRREALLQREGRISSSDEMVRPTRQHNPRQNDFENPVLGHADSAAPSCSTIESADTTPPPSISDSASPFYHSVSYHFSKLAWFSAMFSRGEEASSEPQCDVEQPPSLPDMEAHSRSSTLVKELVPKDSSMPRLPSFISRWVHSMDTQQACDDLEARPGHRWIRQLRHQASICTLFVLSRMLGHF